MGVDVPMDDPWADHPDHPVADWQAEVANGDTRLGYWDWVSARFTRTSLKSKDKTHDPIRTGGAFAAPVQPDRP